MIIELTGAISGVISLLGVIYLLGYWKGKVDITLENLRRAIEQYPPAESAVMIKTLWDIYVIDALHQRPDLVDHNSPYRIKNEEIIPDSLKERLRQTRRGNPTPDGWQVVNALGVDAIIQMADEKHLSFQESVALLATYFQGVNT